MDKYEKRVRKFREKILQYSTGNKNKYIYISEYLLDKFIEDIFKIKSLYSCKRNWRLKRAEKLETDEAQS